MNQKENISEEIYILGIPGSLRAHSYTRLTVQIALQGAQEVGARTKILDLRDYKLALCDGREGEENYPEGVFSLRKEVSQAQGIILGTPEYHGGYSGVLKNALDLMGFPEFEGKMIGLVGVSGGDMGAIDALSGLRNIGRNLHSWVIPQQASISEVTKKFNPDGTMRSEKLQERVKEVGRQVARFAYLHSSDKVQNFLHLWEEAPLNPGGEVK